MITYLNGTLVEKQPTRCVVEAGGVGYEVLIPLSTYEHLPQERDQVRILTHHHVREEAELLYGFMSEDDRSLFQKMLSVSGIGPKLALGVLSGLSSRELKAAVVGGDVKRLSSVSGVGKKTAERLIIELKDKISAGEAFEATAGGPDALPGDIRLRDASLALMSLGYKQADAQKMVSQIAGKIGSKDSVEDIVRLALTK